MTDLELRKELNELMAWRVEVDKQQLKFPLDAESRRTVEHGSGFLTGLLVVKDRNLTSPMYFTDLLGFGMGVRIPGIYSNVTIDESLPTERVIPTSNYYLYASVPLVPFTFDAGTDTLTYTGHPQLVNGDLVGLVANGSLPTGLSDGVSYYVVNRSAKTFQLSLTQGGSAINILVDNGSLEYYFGKL